MSLSKAISRRSLFTMAGATAAGLALNACGGGSTPSGGGGDGKVNVTIFLFAGTASVPMVKAFGDEYMAAHTNVAISYYENSNTLGYPKMLAARQADPTKPLVNMGFFNAQTAAQGDLDKMWKPLDTSKLSNAADILPVFAQYNKSGVGVGTDSVGVVYNTDKLKTPPDSWTDLWAPENKGLVALPDRWWQAVYEYTKINNGNLDTLAEGFAFWKANAAQIKVLSSSNDEFKAVLADGTAVIGSHFNGAAQQWRRDGAPIDYAPPSEGGISVPTYLQMADGNSEQQQEVCQDIINELISPKWCGEWSKVTATVPANSKAALPDDLKALPAFAPEAVSKLQAVDWAVVARNIQSWNQSWDQDVKANI